MVLLRGRTPIRSLQNNLRGIPANSTVVVALSGLGDHAAQLQRAGFSDQLEVGETILPSPRGNTSKFNALGKEVIHRDRPKEQLSRQMWWTWEQWRGRDTETRSRAVDVPYERYPRSFVEPPGIELTVGEQASGEKVVVTQAISYTDENSDALLHRINLFRDLFGEATVLTEGLEPFSRTVLRRLNWDVLPPGELPWARLKRHLKPILQTLGPRTGPVVEQRLRLLTETHHPDFAAIGRAGFAGYIIYGYEAKSMYVLESLRYGNATYVFGEEWERLSQLTKAEVIRGELHEARLVHDATWLDRMDSTLQ